MANRVNRNPRRQYIEDDDDEEDDRLYREQRGQRRYEHYKIDGEFNRQRQAYPPNHYAQRTSDRQPPRGMRVIRQESDDSQEEEEETGFRPRRQPSGNQRARKNDDYDVEEHDRHLGTHRGETTVPLPKQRTVFPEFQQRREDSEDRSSPETYSSPRPYEGQRGRRNDMSPGRGRPHNRPQRNRQMEKEYLDPETTPERYGPSPPQRINRRDHRMHPNRDVDDDEDDDDSDDDYHPRQRQPQSNRGRTRRDRPVPPRESRDRKNPHQERWLHMDDESSDEDSDDSVYVRHNQQCGRIRSTPNISPRPSFRRENEITPESLIKILEKKRDMRETLLNLLENYQLKTSSVRHLVSVNPNIFQMVGETVEFKVKVQICSAHNGSKGCFNRNACRDLHICSKYVDNKCHVEDCVMGHSWKTRHNTNVLEKLSIESLSGRSLEKVLQSSLSLSSNPSHSPPGICNDYNQGKCQRRNCHYLHICSSYVVGRSKCSKQSCKLNHDLLNSNCCIILKSAGIDTNESPRDVLVALLEANPALKKKGAHELKSPSTQNPGSDKGKPNDSVKTSEKIKSDAAPVDTKKKDTRSKKKSTAWSYYTRGDVDIVEICYNSVENVCPNEGSGCKRLHALEHYHWQVSENATTWLNLQSHQVTALERSFCDVSSDEASVPRFDPSQQNVKSNSLLLLLGRDTWKAKFDCMKITNSTKTKSYQIRRLSTELVSGKTIKPSFIWYFLDKQQNWVEYGKVDSLGETTLVSSLSSDAIEQQYLKDCSSPMNFQNAKFNYTLDFNCMTQTNQHTQISREVRRRPEVHLEMEEEDQQAGKRRQLPSDWDKMQPTERLKRVGIAANSEEYKKILQLLGNQISVNNVIKLEKVQNRFHWNAFQNKIEEMASIYGDISKVNIRQLFHGTGHNIVQNICSENFDPRLHGLSAGQAYGQGTYFARDANLSYGYCKADTAGQKYMFVAQVAVGSIILGNSSMARPPINSATGAPFDSTGDNVTNPSIIVKYDKAEYYPEYIFTLK